MTDLAAPFPYFGGKRVGRPARLERVMTPNPTARDYRRTGDRGRVR